MSARPSEPNGSSRKLLIADDERSLRLLVAATLASEDYEILEAADGLEALQLARSERPQARTPQVGPGWCRSAAASQP